MTSLAVAFRESWPGAVAPAANEGQGELLELEGRLGALVTSGRDAWPDIPLAPELLVAYLAARIPAGDEIAEALERVRPADLHLACACSLGDARALTVFETTILSAVPRFIGRIDRSADFVDRVTQTLRERLFVGGEAARIHDYTGRGALAAWVRVAAIRTALNEKRTERREAKHIADGEEPEATTADPELDVLRARYAGEVKEALEASLRALTLDQRNVLRMHYIDGLSIDAIGPAYSVHRATAARWIAEARASILAETKRLLHERLRTTPSELESVLALVRSRIDVSIRRFIESERV